jgi:hypothetical protein
MEKLKDKSPMESNPQSDIFSSFFVLLESQQRINDVTVHIEPVKNYPMSKRSSRSVGEDPPCDERTA